MILNTLYRRLYNIHAGFTYDCDKDKLYEDNVGFAISSEYYELKVPRDLMTRKLFDEIFVSYITYIHKLSKKRYFGGYVDGNYFVFDITEITNDLQLALYMGIKHKQKSIYDFFTQEVLMIKDFNIPYVMRTAKKRGYD